MSRWAKRVGGAVLFVAGAFTVLFWMIMLARIAEMVLGSR